MGGGRNEEGRDATVLRPPADLGERGLLGEATLLHEVVHRGTGAATLATGKEAIRAVVGLYAEAIGALAPGTRAIELAAPAGRFPYCAEAIKFNQAQQISSHGEFALSSQE